MSTDTAGAVNERTPSWFSRQWLLQVVQCPYYPFVPLVAGAALPASALVWGSHKKDPSVSLSVRLRATMRAVQALAVGTTSNLVVCGIVGSGFYLGGIHSIADFRQFMSVGGTELRTALKPDKPPHF
eukprot:754580-Pyramimonas_sp.AAC.3